MQHTPCTQGWRVNKTYDSLSCPGVMGFVTFSLHEHAIVPLCMLGVGALVFISSLITCFIRVSCRKDNKSELQLKRGYAAALLDDDEDDEAGTESSNNNSNEKSPTTAADETNAEDDETHTIINNEDPSPKIRRKTKKKQSTLSDNNNNNSDNNKNAKEEAPQQNIQFTSDGNDKNDDDMMNQEQNNNKNNNINSSNPPSAVPALDYKLYTDADENNNENNNNDDDDSALTNKIRNNLWDLKAAANFSPRRSKNSFLVSSHDPTSYRTRNGSYTQLCAIWGTKILVIVAALLAIGAAFSSLHGSIESTQLPDDVRNRADGFSKWIISGFDILLDGLNPNRTEFDHPIHLIHKAQNFSIHEIRHNVDHYVGKYGYFAKYLISLSVPSIILATCCAFTIFAVIFSFRRQTVLAILIFFTTIAALSTGIQGASAEIAKTLGQTLCNEIDAQLSSPRQPGIFQNFFVPSVCEKHVPAKEIRKYVNQGVSKLANYACTEVEGKCDAGKNWNIFKPENVLQCPEKPNCSESMSVSTAESLLNNISLKENIPFEQCAGCNITQCAENCTIPQLKSLAREINKDVNDALNAIHALQKVISVYLNCQTIADELASAINVCDDLIGALELVLKGSLMGLLGSLMLFYGLLFGKRRFVSCNDFKDYYREQKANFMQKRRELLALARRRMQRQQRQKATDDANNNNINRNNNGDNQEEYFEEEEEEEDKLQKGEQEKEEEDKNAADDLHNMSTGSTTEMNVTTTSDEEQQRQQYQHRWNNYTPREAEDVGQQKDQSTKDGEV